MGRQELNQIAKALVAEGKGILAADETVPTLTKRFATLKIESTEDSRRTYREMFFTTPEVSAFISGAILQDETIRQKNASGKPLAEVLSKQGIIPGIKVDTGAKVLAGSPEEKVTEGLDGLRDRLKEYAAMGARFAKWRAVIRITDTLPSPMCVSVNAHALARYAALCQEQNIVPIVEPEVLMDGSHTIERCEEVTSSVLHAVFDALFEQCIRLEGMLLKPNMVISGKECSRKASVEEVATATLRCLSRHVPAAVPGIVFLSGEPEVIVHREGDKVLEPYEELTIQVPETYQGAVIEELGKRRGELRHMRLIHSDAGPSEMHLEYHIPTRGIMGLKNLLVTKTRGTIIMHHVFVAYEPVEERDLEVATHGSLVAHEDGTSTGYAIFMTQERGTMFIGPVVEVYRGMVVGENSRDEDMDVNVCKEKHLSNMRASGTDEALVLTPPREMGLEFALEYIGPDELVEVTPKSLRIRKRLLNPDDRRKARKSGK